MSKILPQENEFDWLANVYTLHGAINHPSELHGILLGHLAAGIRLNDDAWIGMVLEHMGVETLDDSRQVHVKEDLLAFYHAMDQELEQDSSNLKLLLPDDDFPISERLEAVSLWVRGFLEGLAIAAGAKLAKVEGDLQEILKDLVAISQIDTRVAESESAERELVEVTEYVRIGVLNLYAEFNEPKVQSEQEPTLH